MPKRKIEDVDRYLAENNYSDMTFNQRVAYHVHKLSLDLAKRVDNIYQGEAIRSAIDAHREEDIEDILQMNIDQARDYTNIVSIEAGYQASSENSGSNVTEIANESYMMPIHSSVFIGNDPTHYS